MTSEYLLLMDLLYVKDILLPSDKAEKYSEVKGKVCGEECSDPVELAGETQSLLSRTAIPYIAFPTIPIRSNLKNGRGIFLLR